MQTCLNLYRTKPCIIKQFARNYFEKIQWDELFLFEYISELCKVVCPGPNFPDPKKVSFNTRFWGFFSLKILK